MSSAIPTPETVTVSFFTEQLQKAGYAGVEVTDFVGAPIGTGQIGECIRYALSLSGDDGSAPHSLIGKFPSRDPQSRQTGVQLRNYIKEVSFYRTLQGTLEIRTPRCYFAEIEGEGPTFMLLLEDLSPSLPGDQLKGCSPAVARAAVLELVGLHAPSWCDEALRDVEWLDEATEDRVALGRAIYQAQLAPFLARFQDRLEPDEVGIIEAVASSKGPPFELLSDPFSLVHIDYRLDNLMIDEQAESTSVCAVDWQSISLGNPLTDVAYFLGAGLLPEVRRGAEEEIVRAYHDALIARGIEGYTWDRCWEDYRRGSFAGFAVTVIASVMVQQTARGDEMFTTMARRHARHALDLEADGFLA
jgi:hypothetical protein